MKKDSDEETEGTETPKSHQSVTFQPNITISSPPSPKKKPHRPKTSSSSSYDQHFLKHPLATETVFDETEKTDTEELDDDTISEEEEQQQLSSLDIDQPGRELARASISHADAKDRHGEFQNLLAESAALVDRMLGDPRTAMEQHEAHYHEPSSDTDPFVEDVSHLPSYLTQKSTHLYHPPRRGGSVLGSLMKLEHQRQLQVPRPSLVQQQPGKIDQQEIKKKKKIKKKEVDEKRIKRHKKSKSLYNMPQHSLSADMIKRPKRPKMASSNSWLTEMTRTQHLVPSLDKRKAQTNGSSRRSSKDSTMTRASQFEPISLEDRIRITFEIANILQKQTFLRKLVKCLMLYGCPAHRLEYILRTVSKTLGVEAEYVYLPNIMLMNFVDPDMHTTETHFVRQTQMFDMHKLGEIYRLEKLVAHGEVSVDEALEFIDKVTMDPDFYPFWMGPFTYALASFCGCVMFYGGTWREAGLASALAVFFAIYELFSGRLVSFQPIYEITCCIIVGFISRAVGKFGFCFTPVAFASFIIILPGYSMTISIVELVSRQLVCGIVRMVYAIIYCFLLGYGITMGSSLYITIDPSAMNQKDSCQRTEKASTCLTTVPEVFYFLTVPLFAITYCIYLRARIPRWPVMISVGIIGFVVNWALACRATSPSQVLQVVPAFAIGLLGNLYTKFTQKMSFDAVLLGVFYLVPGSLGLKSALGFFGASSGSEFSNQGAGFALSMIEAAIGISIGLFVATLIVYPRGTTHTPLMNF
ncbi:uncharacterized protein BX664DRAFT_282229 [Halteromyces radiatus]|uniref:uncharacterized protein n=1 Tax=Halteromyces radiatus TaxID=101107 RepID=UPI00221EE5D7|nr:uncharacterized protein BX664DRAFT_282229 [Halteromyces radiatus]KAI8086365.1 hypothetical protein BX664DRAFT_282229 [Halteromyces radiatus]